MTLDSMRLVRWCFDMALAVWLFHPIPREGERPGPGRLLLAAGCLLANLPIYIFIDLLDGNILRFLYRAALYALYLRLAKGLDWERCAYFALLGWLFFNLCSNVFLTPALRDYYFVAHLSEVTPATILLFLASFGVITLVSRSIPFAHIR